MSRLTEKNMLTKSDLYCMEIDCELDTVAKWHNKLSQLEDIEQELGVDLITLFKALKNGIWYKKDRKILYWKNCFEKPIKLEVDDEHYRYSLLHCTELTRNAVYTVETVEDFLLYEYGKTWSLTKEELE